MQEEAQRLLTEYLAQLTHTSSSGVPTSFGVDDSISDSIQSVELRQPILMPQFLEQQPIAEAGSSGAQQ